jgi:hypothetical protein
MDMRDQADKAFSLLDTDPIRAERVLRGEEPPPEGLRTAALFVAKKSRVIESGSVEDIVALAHTEHAATAASRSGQEVKAADILRFTEDPVEAIRDVEKARAAKVERTTGKKVNPSADAVEVERLRAELADVNKKLEARGISDTSNESSRSPKTKSAYGSRNKIVTTDAYNVVRSELRDIFASQMNVGLDPVVAVKMTKLGVYHLEAGVRSFAEWSARVINDVGAKVEPYLKDIWKQSKAEFDRASKEKRAGSSAKSRETRLKNEAVDYEDRLNTLDFREREKTKLPIDAETAELITRRNIAKANLRVAEKKSPAITTEEAQRIVELTRDMTSAKSKWTAGDKASGYGATKVVYDKYVQALKDGDQSLRSIAGDRVGQFLTEWNGKEGKGGNPAKAVTTLLKDAVNELSNITISLIASVDNSFLLRHGWKLLGTHPTVWWPMAKESFKDIYTSLREKHGNQRASDAVMAELYEKPDY